MNEEEIIEGLQYIKDKLFHKGKSLDEVKDWLVNVSDGLLTDEGINLKNAILNKGD